MPVLEGDTETISRLPSQPIRKNVPSPRPKIFQAERIVNQLREMKQSVDFSLVINSALCLQSASGFQPSVLQITTSAHSHLVLYRDWETQELVHEANSQELGSLSRHYCPSTSR